MQPKRIALPEIDKIVAASNNAVTAHREEIRQTRQISSSLLSLVAAEAPEFIEKAKQISALINGAMDQEEIVANAEDRLADDLNDISARYDAIFRVAQSVVQGRGAFEGTQRKVAELEKQLQDDRARGGARAAKLEGELGAAKEARKQAATVLEALLERFIDQRQRYIAFKVRCLHRGFENYGRIVADSLAVEGHLLEQLEREVSQTTANIDDFFIVEEPEAEQAQEGEQAPEPTAGGEGEPQAEGGEAE
jgi:hypothetical protein